MHRGSHPRQTARSQPSDASAVLVRDRAAEASDGRDADAHSHRELDAAGRLRRPPCRRKEEVVVGRLRRNLRLVGALALIRANDLRQPWDKQVCNDSMAARVGVQAVAKEVQSVAVLLERTIDVDQLNPLLGSGVAHGLRVVLHQEVDAVLSVRLQVRTPVSLGHRRRVRHGRGRAWRRSQHRA